MKTIQALTLASLLALPILSACATDGPPPPPRVVTQADAGPIALARGQGLEVRLSSSAGTGYAWRLDAEAPIDVLSGGSSHDVAASPGLPGGALTTVYTYQATGRGATDLSFTFKRAWEPDRPDDRKAVFTVTVR